MILERIIMKLFYVIAILLAGIASSAPYSDPTATTISEIRAHPIEERRVTVEGQVTQILGFEHYAFSDGTGTIQLDADEIPSSSFPLNKKLVVRGEIDYDDGVLEIDVDWVTPAS
ncbi:MAG: NirD/YgiW/YdeI family stress tolerance protein [Methanothrix sp.]